MISSYQPHKTIQICWLVVGLFMFQSQASAAPQLVGADLSHSSVYATSSYDKKKKLYIYSYDVHGGIENRGSIIGVDIDIHDYFNLRQSNTHLNHKEYSDIKRSVSHGNGRINLEKFKGWVHSSTGWLASSKYKIKPGRKSEGFRLSSPHFPGISRMRLMPSIHEFGLYGKEDDPLEIRRQLEEFIDSLNVFVYTLGPVDINPGSFTHWKKFYDDLVKSKGIGWFSDDTLAQILIDQLGSARDALFAGDGKLAKYRLKTLIEKTSNAGENKLRREVRDLIAINTKILLAETADIPTQMEPTLTFSPSLNVLPIGDVHTVTAKVVNAAQHDHPIPDVSLNFDIPGRENMLFNKTLITDSNGEATFSYSEKETGLENILISGRIEGNGQSARKISERAYVKWVKGPDLEVIYLHPASIYNKNDKVIRIRDSTKNTGSTTANETVTRYYISRDAPPFDVSKAIIIGERKIPPMIPGAENNSKEIDFPTPRGLGSGNYYLAACTDAGSSVVEYNEKNNCYDYSDYSFQTFSVEGVPAQQH